MAAALSSNDTILLPVEFLYSSSSSSGPGAYAPDAPQPIDLLCDPYPPLICLDVPTSAARHLHAHKTREILAAKSGTVGENVGR